MTRLSQKSSEEDKMYIYWNKCVSNMYNQIKENKLVDEFLKVDIENKGFMFNDLANYSSNTAKPNKDGTYTISFGCGENEPNNMEIDNPTKQFNIIVRHYQPSKRVIEDNYRLVPLMKTVKED